MTTAEGKDATESSCATDRIVSVTETGTVRSNPTSATQTHRNGTPGTAHTDLSSGSTTKPTKPTGSKETTSTKATVGTTYTVETKVAAKGTKTEPHKSMTDPGGSSSRQTEGNDQVSVDKPHQPLTKITAAAAVAPATTKGTSYISSPVTAEKAVASLPPKASPNESTQTVDPSAQVASGALPTAAKDSGGAVVVQSATIVTTTTETGVAISKASPSTSTQDADKPSPHPTSVASSDVPKIPSQATTAATQVSTQPTNSSTANPPPASTSSASLSTNPALPLDPVAQAQAAADEALRQQRLPLTSLYDTFVVPQDTCLFDARKRLETAITQTRTLRHAFTSRVYQKYRVCLQPPPSTEDILSNARQDPVNVRTRLLTELEHIKEEKDQEKKQAQKLNAEMAQAGTQSTLNVDNADQLMYYSAGLNLVILPEHEMSPAWASLYPERAPMNGETGQRAKGLSLAAATAGEAILDRTRKAAAMQADRQRRKQLQLLSTDDGGSSISRLQEVLATAQGPPSTVAGTAPTGIAKATLTNSAVDNLVAISTNTTSKKTMMPKAKLGSTGFKSGRGRAPVNLSTSTLLSLHPNADDLRDKPKGAATAALIARGIGSSTSHSSKSTHQRLRHPHPESLGGRRRASMNPQKKDSIKSEPFLPAYLAMTLPPLPAAKERLERKPLPTCTSNAAATDRAKTAVRAILEQFVDDEHGKQLIDLTKIRLLHNLRRISNEVSKGLSEIPFSQPPTGEPPPLDTPVDPVVAFCVLHSVGLVRRSNYLETEPEFSLPPIPEGAPLTSKLKRLRSRLTAPSVTMTELVFRHKVSKSAKVTCAATEERIEGEPPTKKTRANHYCTERSSSPHKDCTDETDSVPVLSIRGGGGTLENTSNADASAEKDPKTCYETVSLVESKVSKQLQLPPDPTEYNQDPGMQSKADKKQDFEQSLSGTAKQASRSRGRERSTSESAIYRSDSTPSEYLNSQMGNSTHMQSYVGQHDRFHQTSTLNALHLTIRLRQSAGFSGFHHPAGELAASNPLYHGGQGAHPQIGFDLSPFLSGTPSPVGIPTPSSLTALGLARPGVGLGGLTAEERDATARYVRDQHTVALLQDAASRGFGQQQQFSHVRAHPVAMSALLGHGQYSVQKGGALTHAPLLYTSQSAGSDANDASKNLLLSAAFENDKGKEGAKNVVSGTSRAAFSPPRKKEESPGVEATSDPDPLENTTMQEPDSTPALNTDDKEVKLDAAAPPRKCEDPEKDDTLNQSGKTGMPFCLPAKPIMIVNSIAKLIRDGRFHQAISEMHEASEHTNALEYLVAVGIAVPIPKALILGPLKERLNSSGLKNTGNSGPPPIPRDTVISSILVWLWANHQENFQEAFEKSGRIDVDPECKWLIQAAVDTSFRELTVDIADSMARGQGPFADASASRKALASQKQAGVLSNETARNAVSTKLDIHTACIVSQALMTELRIDRRLNSVLGNFKELGEYLDELRLCALRTRAQERTLLATLVSRKATMAESFSHAFTSSIVRAGEAIGHDKLFETVQNEEVLASTMIPYDIFSDDTHAWEDPCRPDGDFSSGLSAEELMRRAHARAMIHKSLRKLQDRHSIRGGVPSYGPYTDPYCTTSTVLVGSSATNGKVTPVSSPRPGAKRRLSAISEPPIPPGTGSAEAKSRSIYEPHHFSAPLEWDISMPENTPYGRFSKGERARSASLSITARSVEGKVSKKTKRSMSLSQPPLYGSRNDADHKLPRGTFEIDWVDVAGIFQRVELPKKVPLTAEDTADSSSAQIFAPFCRKLDDTLPSETVDSDMEDEDLSEDAILANHQAVLDEMKTKLNAFLEARKEQQERRKNRHKP